MRSDGMEFQCVGITNIAVARPCRILIVSDHMARAERDAIAWAVVRTYQTASDSRM